jgi:[acyl-carrier-protein] S-malonyltransferase
MLARTDSQGSKSLALMFPGQGSQFPGMAMDVMQESRAAAAVLQRGDEVLGYPLTRIMAGDQGDALNRTIHTQPAVFLHSMALVEFLRERGELVAGVTAGHSLGEYSALCYSGVLAFEDALDLVRIRAKAMDEAQPPGSCGMAAVVGVARDDALELVESCRASDVLEAANFNGPDQIVFSGNLQAVQRVIEALKGKKRARAVMLPVSSAFHTKLMEPARHVLSERLARISVGKGIVPVLSNVTGTPYPDSPEEVKRLLAEQVVNPVRWEDCVRTMLGMGADTFVEIGPGKVLTGLLRRIDKTAGVVNMSDPQSVRSFFEAES